VLKDGNSENEEESSIPPIIRTIRHDDAKNAFATCYKWAEGNYVQAEDILTLKDCKKKVLKEAFRKKKQTTIDFFVKTQ
jgi:hypothetical protein